MLSSKEDCMETMTKSTPAVDRRTGSGRTASRGRRPPCLLLLEDDPEIGAILGLWAREQGLRVVVASTVRDATHLISDIAYLGARFQALLADYRLPDATGLRVIEEFRIAFPRRPIALMTAYHDLAVVMWARARNTPIFAKPIDRTLMLSWLRAVAASG
jgi:DNA-binding response OmpR family regulator